MQVTRMEKDTTRLYDLYNEGYSCAGNLFAQL